MEDDLGLGVPQQSGGRGLVAVVADLEPGARGDRAAMAGRQVIEHHDVVAGGKERLDGDRADIAGAAGHEDAGHAANLSGDQP